MVNSVNQQLWNINCRSLILANGQQCQSTAVEYQLPQLNKSIDQQMRDTNNKNNTTTATDDLSTEQQSWKHWPKEMNNLSIINVINGGYQHFFPSSFIVFEMFLQDFHKSFYPNNTKLYVEKLVKSIKKSKKELKKKDKFCRDFQL